MGFGVGVFFGLRVFIVFGCLCVGFFGSLVCEIKFEDLLRLILLVFLCIGDFIVCFVFSKLGD